MNNFIAHTEETRNEILNNISLNSIDDLFKQRPVLFKDFYLENPLSELNVQKKIKNFQKTLDKACLL